MNTINRTLLYEYMNIHSDAEEPRKPIAWKRGRSRSRRTVWVAGEYANRQRRTHPRLDLYFSRRGHGSGLTTATGGPPEPNSAETTPTAASSSTSFSSAASSHTSAITSGACATTSASTSSAATNVPRRQRGRPRGSKKKNKPEAADGEMPEHLSPAAEAADGPPPAKTRTLFSPTELSETDRALLLRLRALSQQTTDVTLSSVIVTAPSATANRQAANASTATSGTAAAAATTPKEAPSRALTATAVSSRDVAFSRQESVASVSSPPANLMRNLSDLKSLTISALGDAAVATTSSAGKSAQLSALASPHLRETMAAYCDFSDLFSGGIGPPSAALALLQDLPSARIPIPIAPPPVAVAVASSSPQQSHASVTASAAGSSSATSVNKEASSSTQPQMFSLAISVPNPIQASSAAACNSAPLLSSAASAGRGGLTRAIGVSPSDRERTSNNQQAAGGAFLHPPVSARIGGGPTSARLSSALPIRKRILLECDSATFDRSPAESELSAQPSASVNLDSKTDVLRIAPPIPLHHADDLSSDRVRTNTSSTVAIASHATKPSKATPLFEKRAAAECAGPQSPEAAALSSAVASNRLHCASSSASRRAGGSGSGSQTATATPTATATAHQQPQAGPPTGMAMGSVFEVQLPTFQTEGSVFATATAGSSSSSSSAAHLNPNGSHSHYLFVQRLNDIRQALTPPEINFFLSAPQKNTVDCRVRVESSSSVLAIVSSEE